MTTRRAVGVILVLLVIFLSVRHPLAGFIGSLIGLVLGYHPGSEPAVEQLTDTGWVRIWSCEDGHGS